MTKKSVTEIVATIVSELTPLSSEERQRVIHASLTLLGESAAGQSTKHAEYQGGHGERAGWLNARARIWIQQNGLSMEQLEQVFHIERDNVEVIASEMPGKNRSEQSRNAYVLTGLVRFLASGELGFDDKAARALCESAGCYDSTNHSKYLKEKGNEFAGSKDAGWKITAPGLKRAATLVKELSKELHD